MRISCAECGAQYEVEATAIPDEGREVQCSACGHKWLQHAHVETLDYDKPLPVKRPPADFRTVLREEAEREAAERRREGLPPSPPPAPPPHTSRRSVFIRGFVLALLPLAVLAALYLGAPWLEREVPSLADPLDRYVAGVDGLRLWLDGKLAPFQSR
ncbi:zinc-ribbon domain-containing protein [Falsirhodobacter deserti]|uniref:zinc-ribbon domain-containing protein n=1 Tax=Falsirhodobacter deserti TaxID=1365611 RepID=UPI000FE40401|nr:zinc-ribbon domain-containing protein [Falsirhodobacter deserti]